MQPIQGIGSRELSKNTLTLFEVPELLNFFIKRISAIKIKNKAYTCVYAGRHMSISCADPERGTGGLDPPEKSQKYRVS